MEWPNWTVQLNISEVYWWHESPRPGEVRKVYFLPPTNHERVPIMTIAYAHATMQIHLDCPLSACPVKAQAKARLVEGGKMVPANVPHFGI
ncbi:hypothetical protein ACQP0C_25955 [Nocardia sp. CA-129566]|uniref:hypothetical protein n=1 Tax=Nocardia sp. CA-129566 TaxID=3239976 RepID=UPI003D96E157